MNKLKKIAIAGAVILTVSSMSATVFAKSIYNSPAEAAAGLTGKTLEEVVAEKAETGKTYGKIAEESGKLEEFKSEMLEVKKDKLAESVTAGTMTQEKADEILAKIKDAQANCDGTNPKRIGKANGAGFGDKNKDGTCEAQLKDGKCKRDGTGRGKRQGTNNNCIAE